MGQNTATETMLREEQTTVEQLEAVCVELGDYDPNNGEPLEEWLRRRLRPRFGVCSRCGCSDDEACMPPCMWVNDEHTLCSECA